MKLFLKNVAIKIPILNRLLQERDELKKSLKWSPGHYYSPYASLEEIRDNEERVFRITSEMHAVKLNEKVQIEYFEAFKKYYKDLPFKDHKTNDLRYYFINDVFSYADAISFYSMLRFVKPERLIEIGSGFSSCVALDTNEFFFEKPINFTFIDPFPDRLLSLIKDKDKKSVNIVPEKLQDFDLNQFSKLEENDILFIDSTHVSKVFSDVNIIFFEILPLLNSGVYIHFHDIFYPFEYPKEWIYQRKAWNEAYLLHAFLQYNNAFEIVFFNTFLAYFFAQKFEADMPLFMKNFGSSIWLRKL